MSYSFRIAPKDRAAARMIGNVQRGLAKEILAQRAEGKTQKQIADAIGVNKSTISRMINGKGNITLRSLAEIAWAIGLKADVVYSELSAGGSNTAKQSDASDNDDIPWHVYNDPTDETVDLSVGTAAPSAIFQPTEVNEAEPEKQFGT